MSPRRGSILVLIPARGGSRGLPRKNVVPLGGRPLIAHVLATARAALPLLAAPGSRVIVSTDDAEIADVARQWGGETPFLRPPELARDDSPDVDALLHALDWLAEHEGYAPEILVELQATSPLTAVSDIVGAVRTFRESGGDPVVTVGRSAHPAHWACTLEAGRIRMLIDMPMETVRRQDIGPTYQLNGAVSVTDPARLRRDRTFLTPRTRAWVMPPERSVDIDSAMDLLLAEVSLAKGDAAGRVQEQWIDVGGRRIGAGAPCFVIAEAGVNHNGDVRLAHELIDAARGAGATAVKFQTFRAELLCSADTPKETYMLAGTRPQELQLEMLRRLELPVEVLPELKRHAESAGLVFLSTPFDESSADTLDAIGVAAFKVGSGELTHLPLLRHLARKRRPILLSTGMASLDEVAEAVAVIRAEENPPLALLHCVSCYPAAPADCNLNAMQTLARAFGVPVGFSDHTPGIEMAIAAAAMGARIVEKHLTLAKDMEGPDHRASLDPHEFEQIVRAIRNVEAGIGDGVKAPRPAEEEGRLLGRRSLRAAVDIAAGSMLRREMIGVLRPGDGIAPRELDAWIGRLAPRSFARGERLSEEPA